jgi:hypothetical protein
MPDYVLKLYRGAPNARASKVAKRVEVRAADTPTAIAEAKAEPTMPVSGAMSAAGES